MLPVADVDLEPVPCRGQADGLPAMKRPAVVVVFVVVSALGCSSVESTDPHARDAEAGAEACAASDAADADADADAAPTGRRLSAGDENTCGIRNDGTLACWGGGPIDVPPAGTFVRVAVGSAHACGIRTSGEVECWGEGTSAPSGNSCDLQQCGQSLPPPGTFIEIAAGYDSTCGLRPDLTIECWGNVSDPGPPPGQFVQMDTWRGGCAVDASGHMECWPLRRFDFGSDAGYVPRDDVKQVSLGDSCTCYLYTNQEVDCWMPRHACYGFFHCFPVDWVERWTRSGVAAVSCGSEDVCAILEDGTITCSYDPALGVTVIDGTFTEITCGRHHCCGLHTDGTAVCWGGSDMPPSFPEGSADTPGPGGTSGATCGVGGSGATSGTGGSAGTSGCPTGLPGPALVAVDSYCVDATEVTNAQYQAFLDTSPSPGVGQDPWCTGNRTYTPWDGPLKTWQEQYPVVDVNWCDAYAYCKWAGKRLCGKIGGGSNPYGDYANATTSQWFNACSAGGTKAYPYGNTYVDACNGHGTGPSPVRLASGCEGGYPGLFDLSGNVWEWEDSCNGNDGELDLCRIRGGPFDFSPVATNLACDVGINARRGRITSDIGFRCCRD